MEAKFLKTHLVIVEGETEEGFFTASSVKSRH